MKVFLINFTEKEIAKKIAQAGVEIIYWTGKKQHFNNAHKEKEYFASTIFHSLYDTLRAIPAGSLKNVKLDFPPKEIFEHLNSISYQFLTMITRIDFKGIAHDNKMDLFYEYIIYWYGVLKHFKPDAIVFTDIPHAAPNYVVYSLAKLLGIKTVIYRFVKGLPGRLLFFDDIGDYKKLRLAYAKKLMEKPVFEDLSDEMKRYVQKQRQLKHDTKLKYAEHIDKLIKQGEKIPRALINFRSIIKSIKQHTFLESLYKYLFMLGHKRDILAIDDKGFNGLKLWWLFRKWKKEKRIYQKEYESLQVEVDFDKKYVYVPLHLQPECNTNPLGGIFDDQILMIRTISASLPHEWLIYVKENPMQWLHYQGNFGRYLGYYKILNSIPNVRLVPADTSTFNLIDKAETIATLTGSAGLEALVRLKPVILFGLGWYMDCEGVFRVDGVESCTAALNIIQAGHRLDEAKVIAFLSAVDIVTIPGSFNKRYSQFSNVPAEENVVNIANALLKELNY